MTSWDVIVVGLGGIGSAACYQLARRGVRVLGLDRWSPPHDHGSSHGATRIIRRAYFEHPDYVPLVERAYQHWRDLEEATGDRLLTTCGLIQFGPADGQVIPGVLASVERHGLDARQMTAREASAMVPQFRVPDQLVAVWEPGAGFLAVERCVAAHLRMAVANGAQLQTGRTVRSVRSDGRAVTVECDHQRFTSPCVVLAPGPWASHLLTGVPVTLQVRRKYLYWINGPAPFHVDHGFPTFLVETPDGVFYGFPAIDSDGLKVGEHSGGAGVDTPIDAGSNQSVSDPADEQRVRGFIEEYLPALSFDVRRRAACYYTMTADEHFVLDLHPDAQNIVMAIGFSGHGFKFAPTIGEAAADLALDGRTTLPVEFLRLANRRL